MGSELTVAQRLGRIATREHGIVTRAEALRSGVTEAQLRSRLHSGALLIEHPGVYRLGHRAASTEARYLAAVRACGDGSLLCGAAACFIHGVTRGEAPPPEVMTLTERRVQGVITVRSRCRLRNATVRRGIPLTTVARSVVDMADRLPSAELALLVHEATTRHGVGAEAIEAVLRRRANSPGAGKLRRVVWGDVRVSLSKLERRFLRLLREDGLPLPRTNVLASERRVDCRWPRIALTVELDSYRYHHSRHAWERDRRREREAYARGDQIRRYTYDDVFETPTQILGELRPLLAGHPG